MPMSEPRSIHATCVALAEGGVLLRGAPGSGKSDLALRLLEAPGARLVADDRVIVTQDADTDRLYAAGPATLRGLLEVRGVGILTLDTGRWVARAPLVAVVDLVDGPEAETRVPAPVWVHPMREGIAHCGAPATPLRRFVLWPFAASAPAKVRLAAAVAAGAIIAAH
ncbi:HPr kinase/phosphorylase [Roseospira visakhapatnamensis]|uniref:Serine kinase of HPr protein (Carbohydrate metabolism regulator) n=1 Tax=Roseospira visakhapatnamensis TaxID=390880 RepID=A0A7W6WAJ6_9PROT|nr:HPr kinase/phosphatase C-terminal domain-containing protein [Roseospira visakhapatnamensis]MBB4266913.1 serine kinase of HPr protein (carbohydrate metabolism regulator) [Roseospira visakhapatnamensis]